MKISETKLRESIRNLLFEITPNRPSTDDKSAGKFAVDSDTPPPEDHMHDPVTASKVMAVQLAHEEPPIDDANFMPKNNVELARAAQAMMSVVADDQVEFVYHNLQRLVAKADEKTKQIKVADPTIDDPSSIAAPVSAKEGKNED